MAEHVSIGSLQGCPNAVPDYDGSRIIVDGQTAVDQWVFHGDPLEGNGTIRRSTSKSTGWMLEVQAGSRIPCQSIAGEILSSGQTTSDGKPVDAKIGRSSWKFVMRAFKQKGVARPISVQSAPEAAAQAIRDAIIIGDLKPGERLIEQKWASQLGIGQPTFREALKELEYQGLVTKLPQRGTYVAQLSPSDYRLILEVRIPLEAIAIGRAARRLTTEVEEQLTRCIMKMADTGGDEIDVQVFHDNDVAFHRNIWELADNEYLRTTLETVTFRLFVFSVVGRWPQAPNARAERAAAVQQHQGILEGLRTRDARAARRAFVRHTVHYWNTQYGLELGESDFDVFDPAARQS